MVRILAGAFLMARLACRRLEVDWTLCLASWRSRPAIEVILEDAPARKRQLVARLDAMFPF